jgi:threonine dehydratase
LLVVSADDVDSAAARLVGVSTVTPLQRSARLSARCGAEVLLKREDLQPVRSYKLRGAYNLLAQMPPELRARGVVCASAGNHGQGVAFAGERLGVLSRVYLPRTTPRQKRERIAEIGGKTVEVCLVGDTYDDAAEAALRHAAETGAVFVPAFDDPATIAGQGTVVREVVDQLGGAPDLLVVPVGGGGLLAGTVAWAGTRTPATQVVGVEPSGAAGMAAALAEGRPVPLQHVDGFVDGAAVRQVGGLTLSQVAASTAKLVNVNEGRLCTELLALYQTEGIIAEPAGALATAALCDAIEPAPAAPSSAWCPAATTT